MKVKYYVTCSVISFQNPGDLCSTCQDGLEDIV